MRPRPLFDPRLWLVVAAGAAALATATASALSPPSARAAPPSARVPFTREVAALLHLRCVRCHGQTEASAGLRLDSYDAVMLGGERGPVVVPGNAAASLLFRKVLRRDKPAMPPRQALSPPEIRVIRRWIAAGAGP